MMIICNRTRLAWAAAAALMLANGGVQASAYLSQTIDSVTFGVIDLTPGDGLDAGFTITSPWYTRYNTEYSIGGVSFSDSATLPDGRFLSNGHAGAAYFYDTVTPGWGFLNNISGSVANGDWISTGFTQTARLTLAPRSLLTVSGNYDFYGYGDGMTASGSVSVEMFGDGANHTKGNLYHYASVDDVFFYSLVNNTDSEISVSVDLTGRVKLSGTPPTLTAVPEPGSGAMLLGGLALFGVLATRRRHIRS